MPADSSPVDACPACAVTLAIATALPARTVRCPGCGDTYTVACDARGLTSTRGVRCLDAVDLDLMAMLSARRELPMRVPQSAGADLKACLGVQVPPPVLPPRLASAPEAPPSVRRPRVAPGAADDPGTTFFRAVCDLLRDLAAAPPWQGEPLQAISPRPRVQGGVAPDPVVRSGRSLSVIGRIEALALDHPGEAVTVEWLRRHASALDLTPDLGALCDALGWGLASSDQRVKWTKNPESRKEGCPVKGRRLLERAVAAWNAA